MGRDELQFDDIEAHLAPDDRHRWFVCLFRLPTQLPLPDGDSYTFRLPGDLGDTWDLPARMSPVAWVEPLPVNLRVPSASIYIRQPTIAQDPLRFESLEKVASSVFPDYEPLDLPDMNQLGEVEPYETVIEGVTQFARRIDDPPDQALTSICFDRCLTAVNILLDAVALTRKDPALHQLAQEEFDLVSLVASRPIDGGFDVAPAIFLMHLGFPQQRPIVTPDERAAVMAAISVGFQGHPFVNYTRLKRAAERAVHDGDYAQGAIFAAVSIEVALNVLLRALLVERGRPAAEIRAIFSDDRGGFSARIRREYAPLLGGVWRVDDQATSVGRWVSGAQGLRNRVVHAGYQPLRPEALAAIDAAAELESFFMDRLADQRYKYPKSALTLLGEASLRRRGRWNGRMKRVARETVPELPAFWAHIGEIG